MIGLLILGAVVALGSGFLGAALTARPPEEESEELRRLRKQAQIYREDALRRKYRALRRGWKPNPHWANR